MEKREDVIHLSEQWKNDALVEYVERVEFLTIAINLITTSAVKMTRITVSAMLLG